MANFKVIRDADYGFVVADESIGAYSFAMVPADHDWSFETRAEAAAQAKTLSGKEIKTRMFETPDRFEAVADTVYGQAWE